MKIQNISWDQETVDHIANHGVSPEEVEQALFNEYEIPVILRGKENKYLTYGETDSGRLYLLSGYRNIERPASSPQGT